MKKSSNSKWIIVSNRLPLVSDRTGKLKRGSGGLITAITGIKSQQEMLWMGSVPYSAESSKAKFKKELKGLKDKISFSPIFIQQDKYDRYYNGICNDVLWPLFHYKPGYVKFSEDKWLDYLDVNRQFAHEIAKVAKDDDVIWIQDFHLFFVGQYLKELRPNLKIGFFLHIPFPSSEIFRQFPKAWEILNALAKIELIGFHEYSYVRHFSQSIKELMGIESSLLSIELDNHVAKVGVFPASIDSRKFEKQAGQKKTLEIIKKWQKSMPKNMQTILGVDRLDYSKGIDLKLEAYKYFLEKNPSFRGKVQLIQLAIPSRTEVPEYVELRNHVERLVSEINGLYGSADYVPVKYIFNTVNANELSALYKLSDMLLVTSKRDGMNLVALEYVVSQDDADPGTVLLSYFTGAISTLFHAKPINPWDTASTAQAIRDGLMRPSKQRIVENQQMKEYLDKYTATVWAQRFMKELHASSVSQFQATIDLSDIRSRAEHSLVKRLKQAKSVVFFIDFDGTLSPIVRDPQKATIKKETFELLRRLRSKEKIDSLTIVSGRDGQFLEKIFGRSEFDLAGEHGSIFYNSQKKKWKHLTNRGKGKWYGTSLKIVNDFTTRVPKSFVEVKDKAIAWHYRNSPESFAEYQAKKLKIELEGLMSDFPITVMMGKKVVEIKDVMANKGQFVRWANQASRHHEDTLYVAIGDDATDEDMFKELDNKNSITIKVGPGETCAEFRLSRQDQVHDHLEKLEDLI